MFSKNLTKSLKFCKILLKKSEIMADSNKGEGEAWLSLREASEKMGVSAATLRVWADEGRIQSYRTPGGHRRFRLGETPFIPDKPYLDTRWRLLEHSALGRVRQARETADQAQSILTAQARQEERTLERDLVTLCTQAVSQAQVDFDARADAFGNAYAKFYLRYDLPTGDALNALGSFRIAFIESVVEYAFGIGEPAVDELNRWLRRVNQIIDRVCVSMLEFRLEDETVNAGKG
jgi:excisionase family DNA binding protein